MDPHRSPVFHKSNPPAGSRPGTLAIPPDSPRPEIFVVHYGPDFLEETRVESPDELSRYLEAPGVKWIDVRGLGDEAVLRRIAAVFSLHPLALEDAVNVPQRAKSKVYEQHQVVVARMPMVGAAGRISAPQVCFVIGRDYLLTFQERFFGFFDPVRGRIRDGIGPMRRRGPDYLAYALLDALIDRYYPIAEGLSHELEELEDEIIGGADADVLTRLHWLRRQLVVVRRVGRPQREAIASLLRDRTEFIGEDVRVYLRDTHDHAAQIMELVDSSREMCVGLLEIYMSNVSHRTNEVMKVLTIMASIFIPLTFLAGIYGMNFEYMPELTSPLAYPFVLGTMIAVAVGMLLYFRRRGWLGSSRKPPSDRSEP